MQLRSTVSELKSEIPAENLRGYLEHETARRAEAGDRGVRRRGG